MQYKNQHYIPEMYQKRFLDPSSLAHDEPFEPYIWIHDRQVGTWDKKAPHNILSESCFYTLNLPNGTKSNAIENNLGVMESKATCILNNIDDRIPVLSNNRISFAEFIALMSLRVPFQRDSINDMLRWADKYSLGLLAEHPDELKAAIQDGSESPVTDQDITEVQEIINSGSYDVNIPNTFFLQAMNDNLLEITKMISGMKWNYLVAPQDKFFISSDNPVVLFDPEHKSDFYGPGFLTKSVELTFPLSSDLCLLCQHGIPIENKFIDLDEDQVIKINARTISCSNRYILSSHKSPGVPFNLNVL